MVRHLRFLTGSPAFACYTYNCDGIFEKVTVLTWRDWFETAKEVLATNYFSLTQPEASWYREYSKADRNKLRKLTAHRRLGKGPGYVTVLPKLNSQRVNHMCSWCGKNLTDPCLRHEAPILTDNLWSEMIVQIGYNGIDDVPWGTLCCKKCVNKFLADTKKRSILPEDLKDCYAKEVFLDWQAKRKEEKLERRAALLAERECLEEENEDETDTDNC